MERNLGLYPRYQALRNLLFWLPVFFLYFEHHVSVDRVLMLEAVYYAAVLVLEVPSGYLSDRVGRRPTLLLATGAWAAAGVVMACGSSFEVFACGQVLLAAGMAFNSGTDSSLLYDSLSARGRAAEYTSHEGRAQAIGLVALAAASCVGGLLAGFDLRLAYVLSAVAAAGALAVVLRFKEPARTEARALPPIAQVRAVFGRMRDPVLGWMLAFSVGLFILSHIPYELLQPWIRLLVGDLDDAQWDPAPAASGGIFAAMMLVSAFAASRAASWQNRFGTTHLLMGLLVLQVAVILALSAIHLAVLPLLVLRAVPQAVAAPVGQSLLHPRLESGQRATFLSVISLAGRGAFAVTLAILSAGLGSLAAVDAETLAGVSVGFAAGGATLILILLALSRQIRRQDRMGMADPSARQATEKGTST